jgi:nitroreductase
MGALEFDQLLRRAVDVARWAPSSHNAQPWRLAILPGDNDGERLLLLSLDQTRRLTALDSLDLEMGLSIGTFLGLLVTGLERLGVDCGLRWRPSDAPLPDGEIPMVVVSARAVPSAAETDRDWASFAEQARRRRTCRTPYAAEPPSDSVLTAMLARRWPETLTGAKLDVCIHQDPALLRAVAGLAERYAALDFNHFWAWSETYRYIRFGKPCDESVVDGFFIESLLGPMSAFRRRILQLMLAPMVMQALRPFGAPTRIAKALGALVAAGPSLICCSLPEALPDRPTLIQAGARLAEIWLNAHAAGLGIHPVSVLLQHDAPRRELRRLLGLSGRPVFLARFGLAPSRDASLSPRRPVDAILRFA